MKGEGDTDPPETAGPERKMRGVGADERDSGMSGGGIFQEAKIKVESDRKASLPDDVSTLLARPATDVKNGTKAAPQNPTGDKAPRPAQERAQYQVIASTLPVHGAGDSIDGWNNYTAFVLTRSRESRADMISTGLIVSPDGLHSPAPFYLYFQQNMIW